MSHEAAWTKDATKKPPDRGGRSFLRAGSFPSPARVRVRGAAFSLAAAVLLGGSRVLADDGERDPGGGDGVFIHIDSPVPAQITEYGRYVGVTGARPRGTGRRAPCAHRPATGGSPSSRTSAT